MIAPDLYTEDENERSPSGRQVTEGDTDPHHMAKAHRSNLEKPSIAKQNRSKKEIVVDSEKRSRVQGRSIPAKRVVSDGHWRKKRSPPKTTTSKRHYDSDLQLPAQVEAEDHIEPTTNPKSLRRRKHNGNEGNSILDASRGDDGIRVFPTPPGSRRQSESFQKTCSNEACSINEENVVAEDLSPKSSGSQNDESVEGSQRADHQKSPRSTPIVPKEDTRRRKSSHTKAPDLDASISRVQKVSSERHGSTRSQRRSLLSQVFGEPRRILSKQQPSPPAVSRVPSIEAWLDETPDPFIDDEKPDFELASSFKPDIEPLEPSTKITPLQDPNNIWNSLDSSEHTRPSSHGSKRQKRIRSSAGHEGVSFPADCSTKTPLSALASDTVSASKLDDVIPNDTEISPSLKRRGAIKPMPSSAKDRRELFVRDECDEIAAHSTVSLDQGLESKNPFRPPGLHFKRPFPCTGPHRLSTIASVETFNTNIQNTAPSVLSDIPQVTTQLLPAEIEKKIKEDGNPSELKSLKRSKSRLTKHSDLISVLSLPRTGSKSIRSARSIRTNRSRLANVSIEDLMKELAMDESKYMRELRTLVDGVIPVLLTCVLSKSDSAVAAGLFQPSADGRDDPNLTKPIVDMGITLERLKSLHKRIPIGNINPLLTWAQGAQRVYSEYLKAWRMGFQDVVVNLASARQNGASVSGHEEINSDGLDGCLPRNENGDVVNGEGERVDVAFLLKRPLVRLKYLAKTLKGINIVAPSEEAESLATNYQKLVIDARNRANDERARMEDVAAAKIDSSRARDLRTLAPLTGVTIDKTRRVRARDQFDLAFQHSTGQCLDCRVELLLRDEAGRPGIGGDLLICEIDDTDRWLLFPPSQLGRISARNGDRKGEIVVMIRGLHGNSQEWQEVLSMCSDDEQAGFEWVQMLGLEPVPPAILRTRSFLSKPTKIRPLELASSDLGPPSTLTSLNGSRLPSPQEIEIPIGERPSLSSKIWIEKQVEQPASSTSSSIKDRRRLQKKPQNLLSSETSNPSANANRDNDLCLLPSQASTPITPVKSQPFDEAGKNKGHASITGTPPTTLRRAKAKRVSRHSYSPATSPMSANLPTHKDEAFKSQAKTPENATDWRNISPPNSNLTSPEPEPKDQRKSENRKPPSDQRPSSLLSSPQNSRSSVPTLDLPTIPKLRQNSPLATPNFDHEEEPDWGVPDGSHRQSLPTKLSGKRSSPLKTTSEENCPPTPPLQKSSSPFELKGSKTPLFNAKSSRSDNRRSSSPLKHEYEPSTASDSSSDSETSTVERNDISSISDSSDDEDLSGLAPTPLRPLGAVRRFPKVSPQGSLYSLPNGTLTPSQSASQAPYKTVPSQPNKASKSIASIYSWSGKSGYERLHPDECSIMITPGLIEAYEMSAAHSDNVTPKISTAANDVDLSTELSSSSAPNEGLHRQRPLVALELTPLVILWRGTALDISIRSPPNANSQIVSGDYVMFRSRNVEECDALYRLITDARLNNPTYIALQNARGHSGAGSTFVPLSDRRTGTRNSRPSSWFSGLGRSASYRASTARTPSVAPSESSIGSVAVNAFSALLRFGKSGGGMFNIARSTITSRQGSIYNGSDNSSGSGANSPIAPGANKAGPIGLNNAKIRLYVRETNSKWRDMGSARLTIMRPTVSSGEGTGGTFESSSRPVQAKEAEKRIVVHGKTHGEVLLDVQLGESCFERVARTGIALYVWEDMVGPKGEIGFVGAVGGVAGGRATVYMIQVGFFPKPFLLLVRALCWDGVQ